LQSRNSTPTAHVQQPLPALYVCSPSSAFTRLLTVPLT
jgi:hypothetical protein